MRKLIQLKNLSCKKTKCYNCPFKCADSVYLISLCHEIKLEENLFEAFTRLSPKMDDNRKSCIEKQLNYEVEVHENKSHFKIN